MLGCNEMITHIKKVYDPLTRQDRLQEQGQLRGSWFREEKSTISDKHVVAGDLVKVRIPINDCCIPEIEKGDILVHATVYDISTMSIGEVRELYADSMEVQSVTYNLNCSTYSRHVRCSGS